MMRLKSLPAFLLLALSVFFQPIFSQTRTYNFDRITTEQGLSSNRINDIKQDKDGFIWIATNNGLSRFDGLESKNFTHTPGDSTSLASNAILSLYCDEQNQLWVLTINALHRYDRKNDSFEKFPLGDKRISYRYENNGIITADPAGNLWISSPINGVFTLKKGSSVCQQVLPHLGEVSTIYAPHTNQIWIGKRNGELQFFDPQKNITQLFRSSYQAALKKTDDYVWQIWQQDSTQLNLLLSSGFYRVNRTSGSMNPNHSWNQMIQHQDKELRSVLNDRNQLWVGTQAQGLFILDIQQNSIESYQNSLNNKNSLSNNSVTAILRDREGVIWLATRDGLNKYDPAGEYFAHYQNKPGNPNSLHYNFVSSFCEAPDNKIWIGTFGQGISIFDRATKSFSPLLKLPGSTNSIASNSVRALAPDQNGNIWIGTNEGLTLYHGSTNKFINYQSGSRENDLASNDILSLVVTRDSSIWIGTNGKGVSKGRINSIEKEGFKTYSSQNGFLKEGRIRKIIELQDGSICLGTLGGGVEFLHHDKVSTVTPSSLSRRIDSDYTNALYQDSLGQVWIGTWDGLFVVDRQLQIVQHFGTFNGLASNEISGILGDSKGDIWISSMNGLSHLSRNKQHGYAITNYTRKNGLQGSYFTAYSTLQTKEGELYFGGFNGFNAFYPEHIPINTNAPKVLFTDFQVFNQSVSVNQPINGSILLTQNIEQTQRITINDKHESIGFRFAAIATSQSDKIRYACYLKGVDPAWIYLPANQRSISYNHLPPGQYILEVKACNADGIWSEESTQLELIVLPPWWKTWWAYLIYAGIIAGLIYLARKNNKEHTRLEKQALVEKIHREKDAEIHRMKINFFTDISHEIRTPLSLILPPLEKLRQANTWAPGDRKNLDLIHVNTQRLLNLINQLLDFRKIESGNIHLHITPNEVVGYLRGIKAAFEPIAAKKNIDFSLQSNTGAITLWFDADSFEKILYNLLGNAFKFTPEGGRIQITVQAAPGKGECEISIRDNGIGVPPHELEKLFEPFYQAEHSGHNADEYNGSGIGLSIVKNLVDLHHGKIEVESEQGVFTQFKMLFRTGKEHFQQDTSVKLYETPLPYSFRPPLMPADPVLSKQPEDAAVEKQLRVNGQLTILLVEDHSEIRTYLKEMLQEDYCILEAANGKAGVELAHQHLPDLVISDIMMPELDGIALSRAIKQDPLTNHIPILLLTAKSTVEDSLAGLETGADDYVSKPFNIAVLQAKIRSLLFNRQLLIEKFQSRQAATATEPIEPDFIRFDDPLVNQVVQYIRDNLADETFASDSIEHKFNINKIQLYRKLKAVTGWSVNSLIREIKIKEAKKLLQDPELNISEVAYRLGFSDPLYFSKYFKKATGLAPNQYKKENWEG